MRQCGKRVKTAQSEYLADQRAAAVVNGTQSAAFTNAAGLAMVGDVVHGLAQERTHAVFCSEHRAEGKVQLHR